MKDIDIIIPIYNAFEYTKECIKSILKSTNLKENSLILINDKSSDERISPMLKKYKEENKDKNIILLENEENYGFVRTVNVGMKYSDNDVILLNSDTEVTENWLKKIKKCAYSNKYIATVTPLTNNGTIASVPNFGIDNELPTNMSLEEYAKMIEEISIHKYPEITTGNGFCMYIKRSVIEEIGYFDEVTFERGYGEENDFCYRALDYGYTNVLCDDTFIYHKGTQSFEINEVTNEKLEFIKSHMKILKDRYPIYVQKTDNFLAKNPLKEIQENINFNTLLFNKKKILYLVNEWEENMEMTGGTSLHLKDIINGIKQEVACFVLAPDKNDLSVFNVFLYTENCEKQIYSFKTDVQDYGQTTYTNNRYMEILDNLFKTFKFNIVHVHHLLFQTFDIVEIAKKYEAYKIITLHDLYLICPSINMVYEEKFCEMNKDRDCEKCLYQRYGLKNNIMENWKNTSYQLLKEFDKIIVPSENTKKQFEEKYKDLKIEVIEHGTQIKEIEKKITKKDNFNIAFVGVMVPHKGSKILNELIERNKDTNIKIHLFGRADDISLRKNRKTYIYHGQYTRGELPYLLNDNNIDLVCIFSTWPETYSYTLTETYMAKVPVLTFDIGAVGDRVKSDKLGWTVKFDEEIPLLLKKIEEIKKDTIGYKKIIHNFENYKFKTVEYMQKEYEKIYEIQEKNKNSYADIYQMIAYKKEVESYEFNIYKVNYGHLINKYEKTRNTKLWKIAKKIKAKLKKQ